MAVIESRVTENGDVIIIKTNVPVVGIVALTSFIDSTIGETGSVYFEKTFKYSTNGGITYSDWIELTTVNVQGIDIERTDYFIVEYRYKRVGTGGDLTFNNIHLGGTLEPLSHPVFNSMVFADFFTPDDTNVLDWALNVLEKLYKSGIIPSYVKRNQGGDDRDFISYWFTITHFFAILVYYARGFEHVPGSLALMREFVKGRGLYIRSNPDVEELFYVYNNYISEVAKRGTEAIYKKGTSIDGELLRLLNNIVTDEFLFALTTRGELGWCVGESSPLYTGADNIVNLIKGYEFTKTVESLDVYPLVGNMYIAIINGKMQITGVPDTNNSGVGNAFDFDKAIVINPSLDYEISFRVQKTELTADLTFGVFLWDQYANTLAPIRITDGQNAANFFVRQALNQAGIEYWIRGIIYAVGSDLIAEDVLNVGFGQNLRLPATAKYMMPLIIVDNGSGSVLTDVILISDIKIRPASLWFSRGLLSARNFIIGYLTNNSTEFNNQQVEKIIDNELIPYNTFSLLKFLESDIANNDINNDETIYYLMDDTLLLDTTNLG